MIALILTIIEHFDSIHLKLHISIMLVNKKQIVFNYKQDIWRIVLIF